MKHVCELAIIGLLLKSVKTRVVLHKVGLISQSEGLFAGFCCTHITNTHVRDCEKFKNQSPRKSRKVGNENS